MYINDLFFEDKQNIFNDIVKPIIINPNFLERLKLKVKAVDEDIDVAIRKI